MNERIEGVETFVKSLCLVVDSLDELIARGKNLCRDKFASSLKLQADDFPVCIEGIDNLLSLCINLCADGAKTVKKRLVDIAESLLCSLRKHSYGSCVGIDREFQFCHAVFQEGVEGFNPIPERL